MGGAGPFPGHQVIPRVLRLRHDLAQFRGIPSGFAGAQDLTRLAPVTVNSDALETQLIGQHVGFGNVFDLGAMGEVNGLGNRVVGVFLDSPLHPHVPFRVYVVGGAEHLFDPLGHVHSD